MNTHSISKEYGSDLSSRTRAAHLRNLIVQDLDAYPSVILNFAGVRTISESFADELFGVLVEQRGEQWFKENVRVINLAPLVRATILETVAERLHETA